MCYATPLPSKQVDATAMSSYEREESAGCVTTYKNRFSRFEGGRAFVEGICKPMCYATPLPSKQVDATAMSSYEREESTEVCLFELK